MARRRPEGLVFVSYAHEDQRRVEPLVKLLSEHFNVWWDQEIELGELWRQSLMDKLDAARCIVVVWTVNSVGRDFIWSEIDRVKERGIVVPVKLDQHARIPPGFDQMQHLDLASWAGRGAGPLKNLFTRIKKLLARPFRASAHAPTLASSTWQLDSSLKATQRLEKLSENVLTISGVLMPGVGPVDDMLGALNEVHRTYSSVSEAIGQFVAPAAGRGPISLKPYLAMERGSLADFIESNRGHCTRIVEYYGRVGGIREWLLPRFEKEKLKVLDDTFGELGRADGDLFDSLANVGDLLTGEASAIAGLLLAGQQDMARKRILEGREKLLPLERGLSKAMISLQRVESSLGFVPHGRRRRP